MLQNTKLLGFLCIVSTALLWSFIGMLSKVCLRGGLDPFLIAFLRSFFACLAFFLHCLLTKTLRIPRRDSLVIMLFGVWGIAVYYACAQYTILLVGASMDIVLQYTAPFWVPVFAYVLFRERITQAQAICLVVAAVGTVCICFSGGSVPNAQALGFCTGIISGICYASQYPFTRIWQMRYPASTVFFYMLAGGTIALSAIFWFRPMNLLTTISLSAWISAGCIGVFCTYLAFITFALALKHISLVQAVITTELEPVLSILWVSLFFQESFTLLGWVGSVLIIGSVLLMQCMKR